MTTHFCPWYPLADAPTRAPAAPGVYQLRRRTGLTDYPTGKSAMVRYGAADDVRLALEGVAVQLDGHDLLCRHLVDMDDSQRTDPAATLAVLLQRFERRFGSEPTAPTP